MFRNKTDDPSVDRIIFIGSITIGIICTIFAYFRLLVPYNLGYLAIPLSVAVGIIMYILVGVVITIYLMHEKAKSKKHVGHKYKTNETDDRWNNIDVTER